MFTRAMVKKTFDKVDKIVKDMNPLMKEDGSDAERYFCADVVGNRRFASNYGGYPRSEIAEINEAATIELKAAILSQLNDYTPESNPTSGMSDAEIMLGHKSKYQQAPSELIDWIQNQCEIRRAKAAAVSSQETPKEGAIDFDGNDVPAEAE